MTNKSVPLCTTKVINWERLLFFMVLYCSSIRLSPEDSSEVKYLSSLLTPGLSKTSTLDLEKLLPFYGLGYSDVYLHSLSCLITYLFSIYIYGHEKCVHINPTFLRKLTVGLNRVQSILFFPLDGYELHNKAEE